MTETTPPGREPAAVPPPPPGTGPGEAAPSSASASAASGAAAPAASDSAAPGEQPPATPTTPTVPDSAAAADAPTAPEAGSLPDEPSVAEDGVVPVPVEPVAVDATTTAAAGTQATAPGRPGAAAVLSYLGVALLGIVIGASVLAVGAGRLGAASPTPSPTPAPSEAPVGNAIGSVTAPVTIEVWADYQCPYCHLQDLLFGGALEREYVMPGIARIVYRDFAMLGQESTDAAVAARCAGAQEAAAQLRYHDALYTFQQGENQGRFVRDNLVQIAAIAGVPDKAAFEACLDDPAVARAVADETLAGRDVGISSTPTLRLRGPAGERVLTGFTQTWPPLRDAIEAVRGAPTPATSPGASATPAPPSSPAPLTSPRPSETPSGTPTATTSPTPSGTPTPGPSASPTAVTTAAPSPSAGVTPAP